MIGSGMYPKPYFWRRTEIVLRRSLNRVLLGFYVLPVFWQQPLGTLNNRFWLVRCVSGQGLSTTPV